jgi:hypothetical protein
MTDELRKEIAISHIPGGHSRRATYTLLDIHMFTQFTPTANLVYLQPWPRGNMQWLSHTISPLFDHRVHPPVVDEHSTHYDLAVRDQFSWQYGGPGADRHVTGLHIADAVRHGWSGAR